MKKQQKVHRRQPNNFSPSISPWIIFLTPKAFPQIQVSTSWLINWFRFKSYVCDKFEVLSFLISIFMKLLLKFLMRNYKINLNKLHKVHQPSSIFNERRFELDLFDRNIWWNVNSDTCGAKRKKNSWSVLITFFLECFMMNEVSDLTLRDGQKYESRN